MLSAHCEAKQAERVSDHEMWKTFGPWGATSQFIVFISYLWGMIPWMLIRAEPASLVGCKLCTGSAGKRIKSNRSCFHWHMSRLSTVHLFLSEIYFTVLSISALQSVEWQEDWEIIMKELVVAKSRYYRNTLLQKLKKSSKNLTEFSLCIGPDSSERLCRRLPPHQELCDGNELRPQFVTPR
jgi:hypothetical protein